MSVVVFSIAISNISGDPCSWLMVQDRSCMVVEKSSIFRQVYINPTGARRSFGDGVAQPDDTHDVILTKP